MNNLATLYYSQGKYEKAESLLEERLEKKKSILGDEHPEALTSMSNLATSYNRQGKYEKAKQLYLKAVNTTKSGLGDSRKNISAR
jgi:Flp pilus assembly protein TadD